MLAWLRGMTNLVRHWLFLPLVRATAAQTLFQHGVQVVVSTGEFLRQKDWINLANDDR